jgi:hypothetical protein
MTTLSLRTRVDAAAIYAFFAVDRFADNDTLPAVWKPADFARAKQRQRQLRFPDDGACECGSGGREKRSFRPVESTFRIGNFAGQGWPCGRPYRREK